MIEGASWGGAALLRTIAGFSGIASQLLGYTVLSVLIPNSPWFSWKESDVSDLGVKGSTTWLFNSHLILAGVLNFIFAIGLLNNLVSSRVGELGVASLILGSMAIVASGIFPKTARLLHNVSATVVFAFTALALLLVGVAAIMASQTIWGWLSLTAGILRITLVFIPWPWSGNAIKAMLSCLPWSLWTIVFAVALLVKSSPVDV